MGDELLSEEELLAHAIALSLETGPSGGGGAARVAGASTGTRREEPEGSSAATISSTRVLAGSSNTPSSSDASTGARHDAPFRSDTTQSYDSALNEATEEDSLRWQNQVSQGQLSSLRSSPDDLGLGGGGGPPESDMDPQNGNLRAPGQDYKKSSRDSLMSSPESERTHHHPRHGLQNITLDGRNVAPGGEADPESHQLPFTRLSSLHDMNLGEVVGARVKEWAPNKEALELIVGMGISENAARRALYNTGNENAELAVSWVFENISDPELHQPFLPSVVHEEGTPTKGGASMTGFGAVYHSYDEMTSLVSESERGSEYKMVLVANMGLRMGVGKVAAQVGHAVLGLYHCLEARPEQKHGLAEWEGRGAKKVVLRGNDTQHLLDLKRKALESRIVNILIHDAGRTQIDPGSLTVLALFGRSRDLDCVTGKLKLL